MAAAWTRLSPAARMDFPSRQSPPSQAVTMPPAPDCVPQRVDHRTSVVTTRVSLMMTMQGGVIGCAAPGGVPVAVVRPRLRLGTRVFVAPMRVCVKGLEIEIVKVVLAMQGMKTVTHAGSPGRRECVYLKIYI